MKQVPFESSHLDDSNGGKFIKIQSLVNAPIPIIFKYLWYNNSINIDPRNMKQVPFESSHLDDSNGGKFIKIQSLVNAPIPIIFKHLWCNNSINIYPRN